MSDVVADAHRAARVELADFQFLLDGLILLC
jgi:hypothetical protein